MDLKKLLELLGVDSLDEDKQNEIKDSLKTIIETRAKEEADTLLNAEKETLVESMEDRFEEYKKLLLNSQILSILFLKKNS